jgi:hypothetical protein
VPGHLQKQIDDVPVELLPNNSMELEEIKDLSFNNFDDNEVLIRRQTLNSKVIDDGASVRSKISSSRRLSGFHF